MAECSLGASLNDRVLCRGQQSNGANVKQGEVMHWY